jgi:hypothetical protein
MESDITCPRSIWFPRREERSEETTRQWREHTQKGKGFIFLGVGRKVVEEEPFELDHKGWVPAEELFPKLCLWSSKENWNRFRKCCLMYTLLGGFQCTITRLWEVCLEVKNFCWTVFNPASQVCWTIETILFLSSWRKFIELGEACFKKQQVKCSHFNVIYLHFNRPSHRIVP